jgi:hypothetical protein
MIEMKLDIRDPEEMRATAEYLLAMANAYEQAREQRMKHFGALAPANYGQANIATSFPEQTSEPAPVVDEGEQVVKKRRRKAAPEPEAVASEEAAPAEKPATKITLEDIRAKTAHLSQAGHGNAIRELLKKYGAANLSSLSSDMYGLFLDEVEALHG